MSNAEAWSAVMAILGRRAALILGVALDFVLFAWTMVDPEPMRLIAAGAFGVLVLAVGAFSRFL